eukprot:15365546-Ditylum_brightwellii.AAC.1
MLCLTYFDTHKTDKDNEKGLRSGMFSLAGPHQEIAHDVSKSIAAIVTCGGLCHAVDVTQDVINFTSIEAEASPFELLVVKVIGRNSGIIARHFTLGVYVVDLCLVPEVKL